MVKRTSLSIAATVLFLLCFGVVHDIVTPNVVGTTQAKAADTKQPKKPEVVNDSSQTTNNADSTTNVSSTTNSTVNIINNPAQSTKSVTVTQNNTILKVVTITITQPVITQPPQKPDYTLSDGWYITVVGALGPVNTCWPEPYENQPECVGADMELVGVGVAQSADASSVEAYNHLNQKAETAHVKLLAGGMVLESTPLTQALCTEYNLSCGV